MRERATVAILGPFGGGNLGDAAIQDAVLAHLGSRRPDIRFVGISMVPADTLERHGIETYAYDAGALRIKRRNPGHGEGASARDAGGRSPEPATFLQAVMNALTWRAAKLRRILYELVHVLYALRKLAGIDLLLVSGGGQIDEAWGGPWQHPYAVFKWTALARLTRTKVAFLSVGVGSIASPVSRWLLRQALQRAQYRSYRDSGSRELVRARLGIALDDPVVPDMAFGLPVAVPPFESSGGAGRLVAAIGPLPYCHSTKWPVADAARYENYVALLVEFSRRLLRSGVTLRFLPGQVSGDPVVIRDIAGRLGSDAGDRERQHACTPRIGSVADLMSNLSQTDIVVASRFHGVLLAFLMRRPVIGLSYERKVRQLMEDAGQGEYCLDIEQASVERLLDLFARVRDRRQTITRELDVHASGQAGAVLAQFDRVASTLLPMSPAESQRAGRRV